MELRKNQYKYLSLKNLGIYVLNTSLSTKVQSLEVLPLLDFSHSSALGQNYLTNSLSIKYLILILILIGLTQANPETRFFLDIYCSKQEFIVETGFLCVSPN